MAKKSKILKLDKPFKKSLYGIGLVCIIICLIIFFLSSISQEDSKRIYDNAVKTGKVDECYLLSTNYDQVNIYSRDRCIYAIAIKTNNESLCYLIKDSYNYYRNQCLCNIAMKTENETVLQSLNDSNCKYQYAVSKERIDLCLSLNYGTKRIDCITEIAVNLKNVSLCQQINETVGGESCTAGGTQAHPAQVYCVTAYINESTCESWVLNNITGYPSYCLFDYFANKDGPCAPFIVNTSQR